MTGYICPRVLGESEAASEIGRPAELIATEVGGQKALRLLDGVTPGGAPVGSFNGQVTKGEQTKDRLLKDAGYFKMYYDGPVYTNLNAPYMLTQAWANLNGIERLLGYAGFHQQNNSNADTEYVVATRIQGGGDPVVRYRITNVGAHEITGDLSIAGNVSVPGSGRSFLIEGGGTIRNALNIGYTTTNGSVNLYAERPVTFGSSNLRIRSKVSDNMTLQIEALNNRAVEIRAGTDVGLLVIGVTNDGGATYQTAVFAPNLETFADDAAAGAAGYAAGRLYKTASGQVMVKL